MWETEYGDEYKDRAPEERFQHVIMNAYKKTGQKVVILVDEYDKPLLQAVNDKPLQDDYRATLKAFYGVEKSMDGYIRFALFTGVTKFSKVSVFSDLNNLTDISMDARYVELCGITEKEIRQTLDAQVGEMAEANGMSKDECYEKLKESYDGYHFEECGAIYSPRSVVQAMMMKKFSNYWNQTETFEALRMWCSFPRKGLAIFLPCWWS